MDKKKQDKIHIAVKETYGKIAESDKSGCCSKSSCCGAANNLNAADISLNLGYSLEDIKNMPEGANMGLGCGNPQAIASLKKGETVLDLGSGGGFDTFLSARAVGEKGKVIGIDMTPEMIAKSRRNAEKLGLNNVEFRLGEIESLPVQNGVIDIIISNCVINLSPDKEKVFSEAFRILKHGGRLAISDIVSIKEMPDSIKENIEMYTGCIAGASSIAEIETILKRTGFENIQIKPQNESKTFISGWAKESAIENYIVSATIEAIKP